METKNINALLETVKTLRSKNGCDWDKAQTHKTIRQNMLEEAYEAVDAIDDNDHFPELVDKRIVKYNYEDNRYIAWFINELNKGAFMPSLRKQENNVNVKEYQSTIEFLDNNKDVLESFYSNNRDLYYEVYTKLESEIQKELSFYNSFKVKTRYK